jgi:hypothetical protein
MFSWSLSRSWRNIYLVSLYTIWIPSSIQKPFEILLYRAHFLFLYLYCNCCYSFRFFLYNLSKTASVRTIKIDILETWYHECPLADQALQLYNQRDIVLVVHSIIKSTLDLINSDANRSTVWATITDWVGNTFWWLLCHVLTRKPFY